PSSRGRRRSPATYGRRSFCSGGPAPAPTRDDRLVGAGRQGVVSLTLKSHNGAMRPILLTLTLVILAAAPAAFSAPQPPAGAPLPTPTPPAVTTSTRPATPSIAATCDTKPFTTQAVTVMHSVKSHPRPVITAIRPGTHPECGYDRITFDFK